MRQYDSSSHLPQMQPKNLFELKIKSNYKTSSLTQSNCRVLSARGESIRIRHLCPQNQTMAQKHVCFVANDKCDRTKCVKPHRLKKSAFSMHYALSVWTRKQNEAALVHTSAQSHARKRTGKVSTNQQNANCDLCDRPRNPNEFLQHAQNRFIW